MHRNWVLENINKVAEKLGFPKRDYTPLVASDGDKFDNVVHALPKIPAAHALSLALLYSCYGNVVYTSLPVVISQTYEKHADVFNDLPCVDIIYAYQHKTEKTFLHESRSDVTLVSVSDAANVDPDEWFEHDGPFIVPASFRSRPYVANISTELDSFIRQFDGITKDALIFKLHNSSKCEFVIRASDCLEGAGGCYPIIRDLDTSWAIRLTTDIPNIHDLNALPIDLIVEEIAEFITELKQYEPVRLTVYQPARVPHE